MRYLICKICLIIRFSLSFYDVKGAYFLVTWYHKTVLAAFGLDFHNLFLWRFCFNTKFRVHQYITWLCFRKTFFPCVTPYDYVTGYPPIGIFWKQSNSVPQRVVVTKKVREGAKFMGYPGQVLEQGGRHFFGFQERGQILFSPSDKGG